MVKASITLSIIGLVIAFLMGVLSAFPLSSAAEDSDNPSNTSESEYATADVDAMEEVSERFALSYNDVINDIASFQKDPSLPRAQARKDAFTGFAQELVSRYENLADELGDTLDRLTFQSDD